jgi:hypothetical protein
MMATTVEASFRDYLGRLTPTATERQVAALHRATIEQTLRSALEVVEIRETGSFGHGTGLRGVSDVDLLVALNYQQPIQPQTALQWVRDALKQRYPNSQVKTSSPTVVVPFANGAETFEVAPGFVVTRDPVTRYRIANPAGGWMETAPRAHQRYVTDADRSPQGGAKSLARLLKAWKHQNGVPISSFYLEMTAAQYMAGEPRFEPLSDLRDVFAILVSRQLRAIEDPTGHTGTIAATSSVLTSIIASGQVQEGLRLARAADVARNSGQQLTAFGFLHELFKGDFPSYF